MHKFIPSFLLADVCAHLTTKLIVTATTSRTTTSTTAPADADVTKTTISRPSFELLTSEAEESKNVKKVCKQLQKNSLRVIF